MANEGDRRASTRGGFEGRCTCCCAVQEACTFLLCCDKRTHAPDDDPVVSVRLDRDVATVKSSCSATLIVRK